MFRSAIRGQYRQFIKRQLSTPPSSKKPATETPIISSSNGNKKNGPSFARSIALSLFVATSLTAANASYHMRSDPKFAKEVEKNYPLLYRLLNNLDKLLPVGNVKLNDQQKAELKDLYVAEDVKVCFC